MIDELEIHRFILAFNKRNQDDWNPSNVNLRKMLVEFAKYAAKQSAQITQKKDCPCGGKHVPEPICCKKCGSYLPK